MKKKWIAIGMVAVIVLFGSMIGVAEAEARAQSCQIEDCKQTGEHEHYTCAVVGCKQMDKHEHNRQESHHSKHGNKGHH